MVCIAEANSEMSESHKTLTTNPTQLWHNLKIRSKSWLAYQKIFLISKPTIVSDQKKNNKQLLK
jgi:hypothetical protein